jgi:hypothetical protein
MSSEYTGRHASAGQNAPPHDASESARSDPWRSWGPTVRYMIVRVAQATPYIAVAVAAFLRR